MTEDLLEEDLRRSYGALETPPTTELEARIFGAVRRSAARSASRGRKLSVVAAALVIAAAVGWSVRSAPPKIEPTKAPSQEAPRPEEIAAKVNGESILWKEIEDRLKDIKPSEVTKELRDAVRRELVEGLLIRQFTVRKGVTVTDAELERMIQGDVRSYGGVQEHERAIRIRYGTATRYREERKREYLTLKAFEYIMASLRTDPELADLKLRTDGVPEEQLRKYYEGNPGQFEQIERISFMRIGMLISSPGAAETKRALMESVQRKLERGGEFAMLAFYYSDVRRAKDFRDMGVSRKDLEGFYTPETIRYLFDDLKEGSLSSIIEDGKTLNIFRMEQKVRQNAETFEEAAAKIRTMMENQIREENRKKTMAWLRSHATLEPADLMEEKR